MWRWCKKHKIILIAIILFCVGFGSAWGMQTYQKMIADRAVEYSYAGAQDTNAYTTPVSLEDDPIEVSLISLIAYPDRYDGKFVAVYGIGTQEYEGSAVYLTREDYDHLNMQNAIGLFGYDKDTSGNGKYVKVEGVFYKSPKDRQNGNIAPKSYTVLDEKPREESNEE